MDEKEPNQTTNQEPTPNTPEIPPEPVNIDGTPPPVAPIVTPTPPSLTATQPDTASTPPPVAPPPATGTAVKSPKPVQKKLVVMGLIVAGLGLLLWPITSFLVAVLFATAGALVIIVGIFVKP